MFKPKFKREESQTHNDLIKCIEGYPNYQSDLKKKKNQWLYMTKEHEPPYETNGVKNL